MEHKLIDTITCDECGSDYLLRSSLMSNLCPECSHVLYGYENCVHQFENGRCIKCFWNGNVRCIQKNLTNR